MAIENLDTAISNIYEDVNKKAMLLPRFQRGFVWNRDKQANLISSFIVNLPFGSLLCLNGKKGDFITRELCFSSLSTNINDSVDYLLDGQQRLSSLRSVIYDLFSERGIENWSDTWEQLYPSLRNRWFLRVKPDDEEEDIFGFNNLKFAPFNKYTDTDIRDFIEVKPIHKTKDLSEPFHPNYELSLLKLSPRERAQKKTNRIQYYSNNFLIPLYEAYKGTEGLHSQVIDNIASARADYLKSLLGEEGITPKNIFKYFRGISNIDSLESAEEFFYDNESKIEEATSSLFSKLSATWAEKFKLALSELISRRVPVIKLDKTETNRAIAIFEAINKGGVGLSVFDLVVAKAASQQGSDLVTEIVEKLNVKITNLNRINDLFQNEDWSSEWLSILDGKEPTKQFKEWFVSILSLHNSCRLKNEDIKVESIKREKILSLSAEEINNSTEITVLGINRALAFLNLRCGITKVEDISFKLLVVVIAYYLIDDCIWNDKTKLNKLEYWYWLTVFSGRYTYRQNEHCIEDIKNLNAFLCNGKDKFSYMKDEILNFKGCSKDILLRKNYDGTEELESSSIRNIMLQFILSRSPYDFNSDNSSRLHSWVVARNSQKLEIHHVLPLTGATKIEQSTKEIRKDPKNPLNSMLNMTYISRSANQSIKDRSAEDYLSQLVDTTVNSHLISFESIEKFNSKNADYFLESRYEKLKSAILDKLTQLV